MNPNPHLELLSQKLQLAAVGLGGFAAAISPDRELAVIGASIIGALLLGFVATSLSQPKSWRDWSIRWVTNFAAGVPTGLVASAHLAPKFPDIPVTWLAMLVSGVSGPIAVLLVPIAIPVILSYAKTWLGNRLPSSNSDQKAKE